MPYINQSIIVGFLTIASTALLYVIFLPQIYQLIRHKKTEGISLVTYFLSLVVQAMTATIGIINHDPHNVLINLISMSQLLIVIVMVFILRWKNRRIVH